VFAQEVRTFVTIRNGCITTIHDASVSGSDALVKVVRETRYRFEEKESQRRTQVSARAQAFLFLSPQPLPQCSSSVHLPKYDYSEHDKAHTTSLLTTEHVGGGTGAGALPGSLNETGVADATNPALLSGSGMHTGAASTTPHIGHATGALPHDSSVSGPGPHTDLHPGAGNAPFTGTVTTTNHGTPETGITGPGPHTDMHSALGSHPDNSITGTTTGSTTVPASQTLGEKAASYVPDSVKSYLPAALGDATVGALASDRNTNHDHDGVPDSLESGTHGNNLALAPTSDAVIYYGLNSNTGNSTTGNVSHPSITGTSNTFNTSPADQTLGEKAASYVPDSVKSHVPAALVGETAAGAGIVADRKHDDGVLDRLEKKASDTTTSRETDDTLADRIANARTAVVGSAASAATAASRSAGQAADYGKLILLSLSLFVGYGVDHL
jgi:hypothetical protein